MQNPTNLLLSPDSARLLSTPKDPIAVASKASTNRKQPNFLPNGLPLNEYTREDLISLLAYYEGELQARDVALSIVQADKTKKFLYMNSGNKKSDKVLESLQTDSSSLPDSLHNSEMYVQLYSNQFRHLNRLVKANKKCQRKFAEKLLETEDRHARELFELKDKLEQTERSVNRTTGGFCKVLEERIANLKAECSRKQQELDSLDAEMTKRETDIEAERERQKLIVLYMLNERKQLLASIHQMKTRIKDNPNEEEDPTTNLVAELRRQLKQICDERNVLSHQCKGMQSEKANMLEHIRDLEDQIVNLRLNSAKNKPENTNMVGYVMANKTAIANEIPMENYNNTGTVRYNKWTKSPGHSLPLSNESSMSSYQQLPAYNGNMVVQRQYNNDAATSNLPRAASARSVHPAMGVRGSQLRNVRPTGSGAPQMRSETNNMHVAPSYNQSINHIVYHPTNQATVNDHRLLTKRSTSLPRKTSNGEVVITTQKILSPTEDHLSGTMISKKPRPTRLAFPNHASQPMTSNINYQQSPAQRHQYYDKTQEQTHIS